LNSKQLTESQSALPPPLYHITSHRNASHRIALPTVYLLIMAAKRPNILFIMADDHASKAISCYGAGINQTPNLDRIAREGMLFNHCYVTNSI